MHIISFTSIFPPLLITACLLLCGWVISRYVRFYRETTTAQERGRYEALDGLRGILAFGVFFQHVATNYTHITTGLPWVITEFSLYRHLGGQSVILFFMITSFLYWSKAIAEKGEMNVARLYRSRFYRLAPMYLFSACVVTIIALSATGFKIESFTDFVKDIFSWLTLGLQTTLSVNGYDIIPVNAGIHWTLHFEWFFYLLLPIAAVSLQNKKNRLLILPIFFMALVVSQWGYWVIFFFGIIAAHIVERYPSVPLLRRTWTGILPILGIVLVYFIQHEPYSIVQYCITLGIFLMFVYGNDLFGIFRTRAARFLGTISYSVYLLHGIVLYAVLSTVNVLYPLVSMSPGVFWLLILVSGILVVIVSSITYRYIEYPFLRMIHPKKSETSPVEISERVV